MMYNTYEHTAHHIDVNIPCYRLVAAQCSRRHISKSTFVTEDFTWKFCLRKLRDCNLYDYDNHRWLQFDGTLTHSHS